MKCLFILLTLCLTACNSPDFELMAKKRLEFARQNQGDIKIVVFKDLNNSTYLNGVLTAVEEINQRPSQLIHRKLKLEIKQDGDTFEDIKSTIRSVASNPEITAVLGHASSSIAVPASVSYDRSQIIFMPPYSTAQELTSHNFQFVFRMIPNAKVMAEQQSSVAKILGYKKIVILYSRDDLSREQAFLFEDAAVRDHIELVQNSSFFEKEKNFRPLISQFNSKAFDAVFIASSANPTAEMAKQLREMGVNKPILGNFALNRPTYTDTAGSAAENTIVPSVYRPSQGNARSAAFIKRYQEKFGSEPDMGAAQGYDSVMLLAAAIQRAGSTIPPLLSSTLHYMPAWVGTTGLHAFNASGDVRGKKYVFNVWQKGHWHTMPAIHIPYLLKRFEKALPTDTLKPFKVNITEEDRNSPLAKESFFLYMFTKRQSGFDHKTHLMEFAKAMLDFKEIGVIFEDTEIGRRSSGYNLIKRLADSNAFIMNTCQIPFSKQDRSQNQRDLIACFAKLALSTEAQYITRFESIDDGFVNDLNRILPFFNSVSVSLEGRHGNMKLSLILDKRSDVDELGLGNMQVFRSLLNDITVQELAENLFGLPEISVNLAELAKLNKSEDLILQLSPDSFMGLEDSVADESKAAAYVQN